MKLYHPKKKNIFIILYLSIYRDISHMSDLYFNLFSEPKLNL